MRTINVDLFLFEELSDDAKKIAIEANRDINVDHAWYEFVYEDFEENCIFGVDNIYFSGFWSQGDGAMFEYSSIPYSLKKDFIDSLDLSPMRKNWLLNNIYASGRGKHSGHYCHEKCCGHNIYWEINNGDLNWDTNFYQWMEGFAEDFEQYVIDKYEDLCRDLYRALEDEYNHRTSDEVVAETLICNEYEFTENGEIQ